MLLLAECFEAGLGPLAHLGPQQARDLEHEAVTQPLDLKLNVVGIVSSNAMPVVCRHRMIAAGTASTKLSTIN